MSENTKNTPKTGKATAAPKAREDRLKAALRANLQRRKAQSRARKSNEAE